MDLDNISLTREEAFSKWVSTVKDLGWTPEQVRAFQTLSEKFPLAKFPLSVDRYPSDAGDPEDAGKVTMYWRDCGPGLKYTMVVEIALDGAIEWYVRDLTTNERFHGTEFLIG